MRVRRGRGPHAEEFLEDAQGQRAQTYENNIADPRRGRTAGQIRVRPGQPLLPVRAGRGDRGRARGAQRPQPLLRGRRPGALVNVAGVGVLEGKGDDRTARLRGVPARRGGAAVLRRRHQGVPAGRRRRARPSRTCRRSRTSRPPTSTCPSWTRCSRPRRCSRRSASPEPHRHPGAPAARRSRGAHRADRPAAARLPGGARARPGAGRRRRRRCWRSRTAALLTRSLLLAAAVTLACLVVGIGLAWLTDAHRPARPARVGGRGRAAAGRPDLRRRLRLALLAPRPDRPSGVGAFARADGCSLPVRAAAGRGGPDAAPTPPPEEAARSLGLTARPGLPAGDPARSFAPPLAAGGLLVALYVLSDFGAVSLMRFDAFTRVDPHLLPRRLRPHAGRGARPAAGRRHRGAARRLRAAARAVRRASRAPARGTARPAPPRRLGRLRWPALGAARCSPRRPASACPAGALVALDTLTGTSGGPRPRQPGRRGGCLPRLRGARRGRHDPAGHPRRRARGPPGRPPAAAARAGVVRRRTRCPASSSRSRSSSSRSAWCRPSTSARPCWCSPTSCSSCPSPSARSTPRPRSRPPCSRRSPAAPASGRPRVLRADHPAARRPRHRRRGGAGVAHVHEGAARHAAAAAARERHPRDPAVDRDRRRRLRRRGAVRPGAGAARAPLPAYALTLRTGQVA